MHSNNRYCLWSGHTRKQSNSLALSSISKKVGTRCRTSVLRAVLGRMQFTLHATRRTPHGASKRLVQAMSAWLVKTRRAPSRHCRDARIYGHTTTAMPQLSTTPPPPLFVLSPPLFFLSGQGVRRRRGKNKRFLPSEVFSGRQRESSVFCADSSRLRCSVFPLFFFGSHLLSSRNFFCLFLPPSVDVAQIQGHEVDSFPSPSPLRYMPSFLSREELRVLFPCRPASILRLLIMYVVISRGFFFSAAHGRSPKSSRGRASACS